MLVIQRHLTDICGWCHGHLMPFVKYPKRSYIACKGPM